jgi:hypothetical protein
MSNQLSDLRICFEAISDRLFSIDMLCNYVHTVLELLASVTEAI